MPDKKDNDDELVQLLAHGELADRQIADRLGLSTSQVSRIARGEKRPDLQPQILAAMRETLKAAWKNGGRLDRLGTGRLDSDSGEASPATDSSAVASAKAEVAGKTAKTPFDRHLAVELIAAGQFTLSQIARRLGIHKTAAWRIMTGRTHPELQPLIREAQQHYRDRARRIGTKWAAQIVTKQIQVGLKDNGWVGLRARQDLLDRFLSPEADRPENEVSPADRDFGTGLADLPEPLKSQVIEALGGPGPEEGEDEYVYWNDPSTWKPVGAAAEKAKSPATVFDGEPSRTAVAGKTPNIAKPPDETAPAQETAAALQNNDVAHPPSVLAPGAEPPEEGCSRSKKRRWRERRKRQQRLIAADMSPALGPRGRGEDAESADLSPGEVI